MVHLGTFWNIASPFFVNLAHFDARRPIGIFRHFSAPLASCAASDREYSVVKERPIHPPAPLRACMGCLDADPGDSPGPSTISGGVARLCGQRATPCIKTL